MTLEEALDYALSEPSTPTAEPIRLPVTEPARETETRPELLSIFALGPARVKRGERELTSDDWTYAKPRELLYYLLSHPPRSREQIGLALWPEASPAQLRRTFHTTLHHLRRALGGSEWIFFEKGRYAFNRSLSYFFDVEAFEKELAEAQRLETEAPEQAVSHLKEAIDLYKGDFLEDFADNVWALVRQEELRRRYGEALLSLGGLLFDEGRYTEAVEVYRKAIARDSYLEAAHRGLMRCLAHQGERGRALRHYEALVELLKEELGSPPAPETTELFERLRRGEVV
jgi:DNA-binding SARP family transcriptional activator